MAGRLVKIAKELNVGTSTIVEYLKDNGFEIENKPTSKVSDEMYSALIKEFSTSMTIKEQADSLVIGSRNSKEEEQKVEVIEKPAPIVVKPKKEEVQAPKLKGLDEQVDEILKKADAQEEKAKEKEKQEAQSEEVKEKEKDKGKEVFSPASDRPKVKVIGKIDLDKKKPEKKPEKKKVEKAPETKKKAEKAKVDSTKPKKKGEKPPVEQKKDTPKESVAPKPRKKEDTTVPPEEIKTKAPQLQGLKILGKIDTKKFDKKPKSDNKSNSSSKGGTQKSDNNQANKRKRKRKKVTAQTFKPGGGRGKKSTKKDDEVKTVSQKEIDDKIKATMARISGGGKKKRQKIRRDNRADKREKEEIKQLESQETTLKLTEFVSVSELASLMNVSVTEVITKCMNLGVIVSINQRLDAEIIELVGEEFGHDIEFINLEEQEEEEEVIIDAPEDLEPRGAIVTVMGHVDHGKTSLLDYIRSANVTEGEAGGITQHIGAYEVKVGEKTVTFLDTPGHEAFTAMRARGAKVTDIVVVIVAADDRIMPQTKEAISHAQAAGVPIVFAINKIDKDGADPTRIKQELSEMNLLVEEWGGKFQSQDISAKAGTNIDLLLEKITLEADLLELKANPNRLAMGAVIEASLDKGRGYLAKFLVQNGTLKVGDPVVAGSNYGKIKAMFNEKGKRIKEAGPSAPVLVLGMTGAPQAGEKFRAVESEQESKNLAQKRSQITREQSNRASKRISLDEIGRRLALGTFKELNLIVKGDVDGSVEALSDSLIKLSQETVQVNVIHKAVGQIAESDILLASASDAIIVGFQVRPSAAARRIAEKEGVQIKTYSIIYQAIEEIKLAIEGMLEAIKEEEVIAEVEVREIYKISKIGTIAGCYVRDGKITRNTKIRIIRDGIVIYPTKANVTGELTSLKRFKDDAKEVKNGMECGLTVKNFNDIKVGDVIEGYQINEIKQTID